MHCDKTLSAKCQEADDIFTEKGLKPFIKIKIPMGCTTDYWENCK